MIYDNFYTSTNLSGTYIYNFDNSVTEGPNHGDHLTLFEDGHFESDTWGTGTFKINGTKLTLLYNYSFGKAAFECKLFRPFFWGNPRIRIDPNLNYYYIQTN